MMKVTERKTGAEFQAKRIEGGFEILTLKGEHYKKLKESSFKKYFKVTGDVVESKQNDDNDWDEPTAKVTEEKPKKSTTSKKAKTQIKKEVSPEERDNIIEKIKKILNLSKNNPSMEEGVAAALKAQELMAQYNIHEDEVLLEEIKDEIGSVVSEQKHNSHLLKWRFALAQTIAKNFRVKTYINEKKDVVFRGYKQDATIASDVYLALYTLGNQLASRAYAKQMDESGSGKGAYNSFVLGFVQGVEDALNEQCTALMLVTPKEVEEEYAQFSVGFKMKHTVHKYSKNKLFEEGLEEGKAAVKSRGIADKKNKGKRAKEVRTE